MTTEAKARVVVVGAGLGGISAAISLATKGYRVEIFEKNDKIGGKLNQALIEGFSFDLGPSIIIMPHLFRRLFEAAGRRMEDYVCFEELQPQWRSFFEDGVVLDLHSDMAKMERELRDLDPDLDGYWSFIEYSRELYRFSEKYYLENGADSMGEILRQVPARELPARRDLLQSMDRGVRKFISEPHLRDMLNFFIKYVGSSSYDAPGVLNMLPYSQLGFGLWYVSGGMYNLALGLGKLMDELGVTVHLGAEVSRILKGDGRVRGVELKGGSTHLADYVVSNMEVIPAYERLLDERGLWMKRYRYMYEPAASGLVVHLGLNKRFPQLSHHNFFFSKDPRGHFESIHRKHELPEDPTVYLVCPTRTNDTIAPEGHEIIKILPHIPYSQDPPFTAEAYAALKERVYDKLERMGLEGLRESTVVEHVLVPEDLQRMYYSNRGAIYGVIADRRRNLSLKAPKQSERYENLFFVGGSVNPGGGTPMVVLCGQKAAERIEQHHQAAT